MSHDRAESGFIRRGPPSPQSPVVLSVPHAGRDYPAELLAAITVPRAKLELLEDRLADLLVEQAVAEGATAFIARRARCWIDLNRSEREIDPLIVNPPPPSHAVLASAKVRGGLGLIPRRIAGSGDIWREPLAAAEIDRRIHLDHRPWHQALERALRAAQARFGASVLMDCHSMPPIDRRHGDPAPRVVIGDRYGRSAGSLLVDRLIALVESEGLPVARNAPYAGGHTLERHGRPDKGMHAIQIEIDRSLYLDTAMRSPGPGLAATRALIARMAQALAEETGAGQALAAE